MISHSPTAKVVSFALAVGIVAGAVTIGLPQEEIAIEGGGAPVEAMMGSSFEDMAVGTLTPEPAAPAETPVAEVPTAAEPLRPTTAEQTPPEQAEPVTPPEQAQPVTPPDVAAVTPAAPAASAALVPAPLAVPPSESAQVAPPPETLQAQDPDSDNYPGQVMRRISRAGKPRVRTTGTATIAFAIASNGGLASVSVARGSGSAALDRAAVSVIRKAAPFPRPPAGARRQYSIKIKGQ